MLTVALSNPSAGSVSSRLVGNSGAVGSPGLSFVSTGTVTGLPNGVRAVSSTATGVIGVTVTVIVDRVTWSNQSSTRYVSAVAVPVNPGSGSTVTVPSGFTW